MLILIRLTQRVSSIIMLIVRRTDCIKNWVWCMPCCVGCSRVQLGQELCIVRVERDGTRAETRFRLSPKRTSPFKSAGASVQSTAGSRGVRISLSNAG